MEVYYKMDEESKTAKLGCCGFLEKWFLGIVNFILLVVGIAQIGCGIYVMTSNASTWTGSGLANYVAIIGACVAFIAFLGCCGAIRENKCLLWIYAFLLFWIILAQSIGLTLCVVGEAYTEDFLANAWEELTPAEQAKIEDEYNCCSFNGNSTDATKEDQQEYRDCLTKYPTYTRTCWDKVHGEVERNLKSITIAVAVVVCSQIFFLFITMGLINGITMADVNRRLSMQFRNV